MSPRASSCPVGRARGGVNRQPTLCATDPVSRPISDFCEARPSRKTSTTKTPTWTPQPAMRPTRMSNTITL